MARTTSNPDFARGTSPAPQRRSTSFEEEVRRLGLHEGEYAMSRELREWCRLNASRCYVPEWLLKQWDLDIELE
jgi:hypothetical protein